MSFYSSAHPVVSSSDSLLCRLGQYPEFPLLTETEIVIAHEGRITQYSRLDVESFLFEKAASWVNTFIASNDFLFAPAAGAATTTLCLGMFDDVQGANALAIGDSQILFGRRLTAQIISGSDIAGLSLTYILAHELAHILQVRHNLPFEYGGAGIILPMLSTKIKELHADCVAGYILEAHREIPEAYSSAIEDFVKTLGDSHAVGDHGLPHDRSEALREGIRIAQIDRDFGVTLNQITSSRAIGACTLKYSPRKN